MAKVDAADGPKPTHPSIKGHWDYVRKKLRRRGVVEVNKNHPHLDTLKAVQAGIHKILTEHPELGAKNHLTTEDYNHKIHVNVRSASGKSYRFGSYSTSVFACIRRAVDVSEEDYVKSLAPTHLPYLEFISNSRSGQDFYFSNNQRFILKTDKQSCVKYFISILRDYLGHFLVYPHSLLVKFLGLYSVKPVIGEKKYFLVMQSIFFPTPRIEERYDIKGCLYNRYQNPHPRGQKTLLILKDQNFLEEHIELGPQREWFTQQLRADVEFLQGLGVQDYSLLLGRHPVNPLDKKESVQNLVLRMRRSFGHKEGDTPDLSTIEKDEDSTVSVSHVQSTVTSLPRQNCSIKEEKEPDETSELKENSLIKEQNQSDVQTAVASPGTKNSPIKEQKQSDGVQTQDGVVSSKLSKHKSLASIGKSSTKPIVLQSLSDSDYLDSTGMVFKNRRLLLNCNNSLHIIDGANYRYYIGIIDFFTRFKLRQKAGKIFKDLKTCCGSHSTEPPEVYGPRFYEFIADRST